MLQEEEKLFIEAIRDLNYQASKMQAEEQESNASNDAGDDIEHRKEVITMNSRLFPNSFDGVGTVMTALDEATSIAMLAAAKISQGLCSPNIQAALSWMEAIRRKEPQKDASGTDAEDSDNVPHVGRKRHHSVGDVDVSDTSPLKKLIVSPVLSS